VAPTISDEKYLTPSPPTGYLRIMPVWVGAQLVEKTLTDEPIMPCVHIGFIGWP
jgi:hypothetical protein